MKRDGILANVAGVLQKGGGKCVYTSKTPQGAKSSVYTEEILKQQNDPYYKKSKGDMFIMKISVPAKDIEIRPNNDIVLYRNVLPSEIIDMIPAYPLVQR